MQAAPGTVATCDPADDGQPDQGGCSDEPSEAAKDKPVRELFMQAL